MTSHHSHTDAAAAATPRIGAMVRWVDTDTAEQRIGYVTAVDEVSGQAHINTAPGVYYSVPIDVIVVSS